MSTNTPTKVVGKLSLQEVVPQKVNQPKKGGGYHMVKACRIRCYPVTGGYDGASEEDATFGAATPAGQVELVIANAAAADLFIEAWREYIDDPDAREQPQFYVTFERA